MEGGREVRVLGPPKEKKLLYFNLRLTSTTIQSVRNSRFDCNVSLTLTSD